MTHSETDCLSTQYILRHKYLTAENFEKSFSKKHHWSDIYCQMEFLKKYFMLIHEAVCFL